MSPSKRPTASHLYTDDNPKTTLHGTGFKDAATAHKTILLVGKRSLTYQFQTINTMLYRAKGHPHKTANINDAIEILQRWVDGYAERKAALRVFALQSKAIVEKHLRHAEEYNESHENDHNEAIDLTFARMYISLPPKARLANTLVDVSKPGEQDLEIMRYDALCQMVPAEHPPSEDILWDSSGALTVWHLRMMMYAYSPRKRSKAR